MLFLKSTSAPLAPGVYAVDVAAKPPGTTYMIYAAVDAAAPPQEFIEAVQGLGFQQVNAKTYKHQDGTKVLDLHFRKVGSALFEGWTPDECEGNLRAIQAMLAEFGVGVAPRVMTLAEAFG